MNQDGDMDNERSNREAERTIHGGEAGRRHDANDVCVSLGGNHFQAKQFNEQTLHAFELWVVAATPGQAQLDQLTQALDAQNTDLSAAVKSETTEQEN